MRFYARDPYTRLPDWLRFIFICGECNGLGSILASDGVNQMLCPACRGHGAGWAATVPRVRWWAALRRANKRLAHSARRKVNGGTP